jgi:hypothetical protein
MYERPDLQPQRTNKTNFKPKEDLENLSASTKAIIKECFAVDREFISWVHEQLEEKFLDFSENHVAVAKKVGEITARGQS